MAKVELKQPVVDEIKAMLEGAAADAGNGYEL